MNAILCHYHPHSNSRDFPTKKAWAKEWGVTKQRFNFWELKAIEQGLIGRYTSGKVPKVPLPSRTLDDGTVIKYAAILDDDGEERDDVVAG